MYNITDDKIYEIRGYISELMRDVNYALDDNIRGYDDNDTDLMEVIAYLYEIINQLYFHEEYHYMFHWGYIVCVNDNTESSWPDYHNCKYYEEENNEI